MARDGRSEPPPRSGRLPRGTRGVPRGLALCALVLAFVAIACVHPLLVGAASDPVFTCLNPCHSPPGTIGPDVKTAYLGADDGAGHKMNWNPRVIESTSGAQYAKGALMPCAQCHVLHGVTTSSIFRFSEARTGGVVTTVRQLCEGCHRPSDSTAATPVVCGLAMLRLPGGVADHADSSSRPCRDCHGTLGHSPEEHGGGADCITCHGYTGSHAIHVFATDPRGPGGVPCTTCHKDGGIPGFAAGSDEDSSGIIELDETTVCDDCHSPGGSYDGVESTGVPRSVGAKDNWASKVYETTTTLQTGKEGWCVGCHDGHAGSAGEEPSYIGGVYAPAVAGDETSATPYGTGYGYYATGHGLETTQAYPASGGFSAGAGLACNACHDYSATHTDGNARTYGGGVSDGGTAYRQGYRLKLVGGQEPMVIPKPDRVAPTPGDYRLCVQGGCHASGPFDSEADKNTNAIASNGGTQVHGRHMNNSANGRPWSSSWGGSLDSHYTCTTCHNVHGSTRPAMLLDGKLTANQPGIWLWYNNDALVSHAGNNTNAVDPIRPIPDGLQLPPSTGVLWMEKSTYNIAASCGCHTSANAYITAEYRNAAPWSRSQAPALTWTFQPYYLDRGVNPQRLLTWGGDVDFRVTYYDRQNDPPAYIRLMVDSNDNGSYEASETTALAAYDGDSDYTDGKIYTKTLPLDYMGDGQYAYRFEASDGTLTALGQPTQDHEVVVDFNHKRDVPTEYLTIQDAIDDSLEGDVVSAADAVYSESIDLRGKAITVESANGAAGAVLQGDGTDGAVVTFDETETASTVLSGFTIDNQVAPGSYSRGAQITNAGPTIRDCVFVGNGTSGPYYGGAVRISGASGGATIIDTVFGTGSGPNTSERGGAIFYSGSTTGSLTIDGCTFQHDSATSSNGGALWLESITNTTTISGTTISENSAPQKGGGIYALNARIQMVDSSVTSNTAGSLEGGGIHLTGAGAGAAIASSTLSGNSAGSYGGAVYGAASASLTMTGCVLAENRSTGGDGGAIYFTGSTMELSKCWIRGNEAWRHGGGVYVAATVSAKMTNCMVTGNRAEGIDGGGVKGDVTIVACTIAGNMCSDEGGGVSGNGPITDSIVWGNKTENPNPAYNHNLSGSGSVSYTDIGESGYAGSNGNINADPLYSAPVTASAAATTAGDYHLQLLSPCLDAATSTAAPPDDIDDDPRPQSIGPDMGADEVVIPPGTPWLTWTGEPGYAADGVDPDSAPTGSSFAFRVTYSDEDSDAPTYVRLSVDVDDSGSYESSETTEMGAVAGGDYFNGKTYAKTLALAYAGDGTLKYTFEASDGSHPAIGWPTSDRTLTVLETSGLRVPQDFATIQAAIDAASNGDEILVAAGTYYENITFRGKSVTVRSADGAASTSIVGTTSPSTVNTPVVDFSTNETAGAVLDGFTIDNSHDSGTITKSRGIYISSAAPTIERCVIKGNTLDINNWGPGVYISGATAGATISETTIGASGAANTGRGGAGVYFAGSTSGTLRISRSFIRYNTTLNQSGGGVFISNCTSPTVITETTISANVVPNISLAGAGICTSGSPLVVTDCSISDHLAGDTVDGAAIALIGTTAEATITGTTIRNNTGDFAPGIWVNSTASGRLVVDRCEISSNTILSSNGGAGIYNPWTTVITSSTIATNTSGGLGGGIYVTGASPSLTISGSTVRGNRGTSGGGIYFASTVSGSMLVTDSTIATNSTASSSYDGGGVYLTGSTSSATFSNSQVRGNTARSGAGICMGAAAKMTFAGDAPGRAAVVGNYGNINTANGGGVFLTGAGTSADFRGATISSNTCGLSGGGAYLAASTTATFTGCTITSNTYMSGAGNADGAGVCNLGSVVMDRCVVAGNSGRRYGGGVYATSNSTLTNCTISGNYVSGVANCAGGGVYWNGNGGITNCTISGNLVDVSSGNNGGGLHFFGGTTYAFKNLVVYGNWCSIGTGKQIGGTPAAGTVTYSDVASGFAGTGNINQPPSFVTTVTYSAAPTTSGDYHLNGGSPCEGVATSTGAPNLDIDNGSRPAGTGFDMGSDEIGSAGEFLMGASAAQAPLEAGVLETLGGALAAGAAAVVVGGSGKLKDLVGKALGNLRR